MVKSITRKGRGVQAFTLIELLVVVAIIALLISILLPSLGQARAQARSSLCASRIAQMCKAVFIYADDFGEKPPFTSPVTSSAPDNNPWESAAAGHMETWLGSLNDMKLVADASHAGAPYPEATLVNIPKSGTLFNYCRFETLYKCPEFDRIASKEQNVFNYTRAVWGRRYRIPNKDEGATSRIDLFGWKFGDLGGPILSASNVFSPSALPIFVDEWWNRHCAGAWANGVDGGWQVCDPVFDVTDELGQYHGSKTAAKFTTVEDNPSVQSGTLAYYDGHTNLRRDPIPSEKVWGRDTGKPVQLAAELIPMLDEIIYAMLGRQLVDVMGH